MEAAMHARSEKAQIRLARFSSAYWRVTFDNPPLNVMGPQFVRELGEIIKDVEADRTSGSWSSTAPLKDFS
jgi:enoyl-CoA hydratase/carnithine racemase